MIDLGTLQADYLREYGRYERLARWVEARLVNSLPMLGVGDAVVTGRAKAVASLLKKALRKNYADPRTEITDKAGVRAVVSLAAHRRLVEDAVVQHCAIIDREDKADQLDPDRMGYLGLHLLVTPLAHHLSGDEQDLKGVICEVQVHTKAETAWAAVSHPLLHKPAGLAPNRAVRRRIHRLLALVELFDSEVAAAREAVMSDPEYQQASMLQALEHEFLQIAHADFDEVLSLRILEVLKGAYSVDELSNFKELITGFVQANAEVIRDLYANAEPSAAHLLLFQPETLAILERLQNAKQKLRAVWDASLPDGILSSLSEELGHPA